MQGRDKKSGFAMTKQESQNQRKRKDQQQKQAQSQILTFVDMSKLGYLAKPSHGHSNSVKKVKTVELPESTSKPILEDADEEENEDEESTAKIETGPVKTALDLALEVLNEILDIVVESTETVDTVASH